MEKAKELYDGGDAQKMTRRGFLINGLKFGAALGAGGIALKVGGDYLGRSFVSADAFLSV